MEIAIGLARLRPISTADRVRLAELANDRRIWRNMTDRFPHPYRLDDADEWIELCVNEGDPTRNFAIEVNGQLVGAIGLDLLDGEKTGVCNVGYWIAPGFWNRGIATVALRAMVEYAAEAFSVRRLQASVFGWNPASGRVLEKCGFRLEGRLSNGISKGGDVTDELIYGLVTAEANHEPTQRNRIG